MFLEIGRNVLLIVSSVIGAVFGAFLLLFALLGLIATLKEVWDGKVGILFISAWFAAGLYGVYRAFLAEWSTFSYLVVGIAAILWFYFERSTKSDSGRERK